MLLKKINKIICILLPVLILSCDYQEAITIKKGQQGGLYETSVTGKSFPYTGSEGSFKVDTVTFIVFDQFESVIREKQDADEGFYALTFKFKPAAAAKLKEMTERSQGKPMCLIVNGTIISAPIVRVPITDGKLSLTMASQDELEEIISKLEY